MAVEKPLDPRVGRKGTVFIVDDDPSVHKVLQLLLQAVELEVLSFESAEQFLRLALPDRGPRCLVLELKMAHTSGLELQEALLKRGLDLPIVFLSAHADFDSGVRALKSGAVDVLRKPVTERALLDAVFRALERDRSRGADRSELEELQARARTLTPRESEVFALVTTGFANKRVAADLGASEGTIKLHRAHVMQKMKAESLADLVRMADKLGLRSEAVPPGPEDASLRTLATLQQDPFANVGDFAGDLHRILQTGGDSPPTTTPDMRTAPQPPARRARDAERRQLSVLVCGCDVFEADSYLRLDAEDQAHVLRAFHQACEQAVREFGGTLVQWSEKSVLACFGFPVAYEDAAGRAARAGLAILRGLSHSADGGDRLRIPELVPWVGIHTGAGIVESNADAVSLVGEARNVAVRLEDVAVAGQVICTDASRRLFKGQFECASLGGQTLKGLTDPVELFRIEDVAVAASPIDAASPMELSPLTGRDQEVGLLTARWDQAREGMGQVVLLIGEPGLGKSRLIHTLKQHVLGQMVEGEVDAPVIEWRCSPHYKNTGLYPAIDFYERALAFDREEAPQARFDRMLHRLEQYDLARPETVPLWASLLSLPTPDRYPPLSLSPVRQREETFRTMLEWLHVRAARKPVLLIVEDLHWIDASTLEFLGQFVAEGLHDSILTILTFRPEFKTPWPAVSHQTSLALNRLTPQQVGELMRKRSRRDLPEALVQRVYDRTRGVPLFVEEFTKMLQETGVPSDEQAGAPGQTLLGHEIPATLQDLVMARLDRMEGGREVAQLASALGREFTYEVLAAVAEVDEPTLLAELARLVQAEILLPKGRPPRCSYTFKHALLEDALYNALVKGKRQEFHRRIAQVLEARFPQTTETRPELLAHHFTEAGLAEKGVEYWLKAGLRSRAGAAEVEAIGHLTKGLSLVAGFAESPARDLQEFQFLMPLGTANVAARGYTSPDVGPIWHRARELCDRIGQPSQRFATIWGFWVWHLVRGEVDHCMPLAAEAMELAAQLDEPGMRMEALGLLGASHFYRAEFANARDVLVEAAPLEDREHTKSWAAYTGHDAAVTRRANLSMTLWHLGYPDRAQRMSREMMEMSLAIGRPFIVANARYHEAVVQEYCRSGADTEAIANELTRAVAEEGLVFWGPVGQMFRGAGLLEQGRLEEALSLIDNSLAVHRRTGTGLFLPHCLSILGAACSQAGQFAKARNALDEGLAIAARHGDRRHEPELHRLQGELHLAEASDESAAEQCFHTAIATARSQQSKAWELRATTSLARLWQRQGRREEARRTLATVYGSYTEGFATPDLVDAKVLLDLS